ncbi:hypothetical protein E2C01_102865 [Portunus trituberculatus]|uniref:Uncharacterized protein n=1 Tax=Portunus trituberculatus TaxID=210409 RepID=A0A5B7KJD7_PORTR|nr:hypothetical protein [Portunus trituberculatus]
MGTKLCNRESKSCSAKYGTFYRFVYTRDSCSVNLCSARYDCIPRKISLYALQNNPFLGARFIKSL